MFALCSLLSEYHVAQKNDGILCKQYALYINTMTTVLIIHSQTDLTDSFDLIDLTDPDPIDCSTPHHRKTHPLADEDEDLISFESPPRFLSKKNLSPLSPPFYPRAPVSSHIDLSPTRPKPAPKIEQHPVAKFIIPAHVYQCSTMSTPPRPLFTNPNKSYTVRSAVESSSRPANPLLQPPLIHKQLEPAAENAKPASTTRRSPSKASATNKLKRRTQIKLSHLFPDRSEEEVEVTKRKRPTTSDAVVRRIVGRDLGVSLKKREDERSLELDRALRERRRNNVVGVQGIGMDEVGETS